MSVETQVQRDVLCPVCGQSVMPGSEASNGRLPELEGFGRYMTITSDPDQASQKGSLALLVQQVAVLPFKAAPAVTFGQKHDRFVVLLEAYLHKGACAETWRSAYQPVLEDVISSEAFD